MILNHPSLSNCKAVFTTNAKIAAKNSGHVLFNAPRPLLGTESDCTEWCHGRHYAEINPDESSYILQFIQKNIDLDARVVITLTEEQAIDLALLDSPYAARYRLYPHDEQLKMLSHKLDKLQHTPLADALCMLARIVPSAITLLPDGFEVAINLKAFNDSSEKEQDVVFSGTPEAAIALVGQFVMLTHDANGTTISVEADPTNYDSGTVTSCTFDLSLNDEDAPIPLGNYQNIEAMLATANKLFKRLK